MNQHIDRVEKRVSKMLGIFSRARTSLTIESANRLFKSMILPILDYCGAVFHRCGKGNEGLECLLGWYNSLQYCPFVHRTDVYKPRLGHSYEKKRKPHC